MFMCARAHVHEGVGCAGVYIRVCGVGMRGVCMWACVVCVCVHVSAGPWTVSSRSVGLCREGDSTLNHTELPQASLPK